MNKEFMESVAAIRQESLGMIKTLQSVKGVNYARVVHAIILADTMNNVSEMFVEATTDEAKEIATALTRSQMNMLALVMKYYFKSTQFSEAQIEEAFQDADRIQKTTNSLVGQAKMMSEHGRVIGDWDA